MPLKSPAALPAARRRTRRRRPTSAGFTLIEVMVVMVVSGILLNLAMPAIIRARMSAFARSCTRNLRSIESAKELYATDNRLSPGAPPPPWSVLIGRPGTGYLQDRPFCPYTGRTESYTVGVIGVDPVCEYQAGISPDPYDDHVIR